MLLDMVLVGWLGKDLGTVNGNVPFSFFSAGS